MPAVWRAVNLISGTIASLPLHAYQQKDDTRIRASQSQQGAKLLDKPHPDLTPYEFWEIMCSHLLLWGNAYAQTLRNPLGQIDEMWPIHPRRVAVGRAKDMTKVYVVDGNENNPLTDREMLHIPGFGYDGICGVSPIQLAKQGIGLAMAAEEFGGRLFGNGSMASGILKTDRQLTQDQATRLKDNWKAKVAGLGNAHEVAVLDNGASFQQLTIPPQDAQFIESRRFQISEVARIFGIPPHMLMDTDKSTSWGTGIEQQGIGFVVYTLRPWLTRIEQRMTRLLSPSTVYAKYSVEGLLRGDTAARYSSYSTARQWGWMSVNEIRKLEELPPITNGNGYIQPLNMGELGAEPDPEPAPDPVTDSVAADPAA
jgi:HK97 family phage portal protein